MPVTADLSAAHDLAARLLDLRTSSVLADGARSVLGIKVRALRASGVSWSVIGDCCGISRQAAQQRFGVKS